MAKRSATLFDFEEAPHLMEPMLPEPGDRRLEDLALMLVSKASALAGMIRPEVQASVGELVRSMNCYYSNLIEGHHTLPRDIERALLQNFSKNPEKRALQLEAKAHIEVQRMIDREQTKGKVATSEFILWIHREFCSRLPKSLLVVMNPDNKKTILVRPGQLRKSGVQVGKHLPPHAKLLPAFLKRFEEAYRPERLSRVMQVIAVATSHHRLLWIHPFYDGNGRVTRLFSHAYLKQIGIGSSLWSVSRGLARKVRDYKSLLMAADQPRHNDYDGRGALTMVGLKNFCEFFLNVCIDQVEYMTSILEPKELLQRIEVYTQEETRANRLPHGTFALLREALFSGKFERGRAPLITGYQERQARSVLSQLLKIGLLIAESPKGVVRLGFPIEIVEHWFPRLYPVV